MNVVFISAFLSPQSVGGPALRAKNSLEIIKNLGYVSVFDLDSISPYAWTGGSVKTDGKKWEIFPKSIGSLLRTWYRVASRALQVLEIFTQLVSLFGYFRLRRLIVKNSPDVVWFSFATKFPKLFIALRTTFPNIVFVADTDAVISTHLGRAADSLSGIRKLIYRYLSQQTRKQESKILKIASITTGVSAIDLEEYRALSTEAKLSIFPNVVPTDELSWLEKEESDLPKVLITGTFGGKESAMTHGTLWFLSDVFPLVRASVPSLSVDIIGRKANQILGFIDMPKSVRVVSDVPTISPYLREAWCAACPLFFESGTRFKILEAAERGVPTVSTTLGAEGLNFKHNEDILIADDATSFAESLINILRNPALRKAIGQRSREKLVNEYSIAAGLFAAQQIFDRLELKSK